ncbi:DUF2399 domain-containing protein [Streptomyces sp. NPDC002668]|uniref:DUF2399 domain-containing protein n=1 Tax=Streptomyces sp. NPDC002668 TaxID=3154422 RepID=UPI00332832BF
MDKTSAAPWRMAAEDYLAVVARVSSGPSAGRLTPAPWDPALTVAMARHRTAILEETVSSALLVDLAESGGVTTGMDTTGSCGP